MDKFVKKIQIKEKVIIGKVTLQERATQFKEDCYMDGERLFCKTCNLVLEWARKSVIDDHLRSKKHLKRKSEIDHGCTTKKQRTLETTMKSCSTDHAQQKISICQEWVKVCVACNIPLSKTDHPVMRAFLDKHVKNGGAIKRTHTLQETYVPDLYHVEKNKLKDHLKEKPLCVIFDELSDCEGRYVLNVLLAPLELDDSGRVLAYLADTIFLEKTNHSTVSQADSSFAGLQCTVPGCHSL